MHSYNYFEVFVNLSKEDRIESISLLIDNLSNAETEEFINIIDNCLSGSSGMAWMDIKSSVETDNKLENVDKKDNLNVDNVQKELRPLKHRIQGRSCAKISIARKDDLFGESIGTKKKRGRPKKDVKKARPPSIPKSDQKPTRCSLCKLIFITKTELFRHREVEHQERFSCEYCGKLCKTRSDLRDHKKHSCLSCSLQCTHCPRKFFTSRALDSHITREHDPSHREKSFIRKKLVCPVCKKEISFWKHLYEYHVASHDPHADLSKYEKFECQDCGNKFLSSYKLSQHKCKRHGMMFRDNEGNLLCTFCLHQFNDKKEAVGHKKEKHSNQFGNFECPFLECDFQGERVSDLKYHLTRIHYRVNNSTCEICSKKFLHSYEKAKHLVDFHKTKSVFQCETCAKECYYQYGLKHHNYMKHSNERRYQCKYCPKAFKMNSALKRHLFIHESHLSKHVCDVCGKAFRDVSTLKAHLVTHA